MEVIIALIVAAVPIIWFIWEKYARIYPLAYFGLENVQRIAKWESPEWRDRVFARGGITRYEWLKTVTRQAEAMHDELLRRNLNN